MWNVSKGEYHHIDLFAGAGGLSEGFIRAGFSPAAMIEMDRYACLTLKTRMAYYYLRNTGRIDIYREYLAGKITREQMYSHVARNFLSPIIEEEITADKLDMLFRKIECIMKENGIQKIDIVIGGAPCQPFSIVARPYIKRAENDKRSNLYELYAEFLKKFKPAVFIFENVPGLLSADGGKIWANIRECFSDAGYHMEFKILNAHDFGVLQNRRRIIAIGWGNGMNMEYPEFERDVCVKKYTVADVLSDLPPLNGGDVEASPIQTMGYIREPSEYLQKYGIRKNSGERDIDIDVDILTLHRTHAVCERDKMIYRLCIEAWMTAKKRLEYDDLPESLKTHRNRHAFKDRFKVVAPDLPFSQTITAHLAKDGHYYIHPDINQLRPISMREAARLQSFPDDFFFEGSMTSVFRQIGNAVPPLMAEKIARKIKKMLI